MFRIVLSLVIGTFRGIGRFWLAVERSHQHIVPVAVGMLVASARRFQAQAPASFSDRPATSLEARVRALEAELARPVSPLQALRGVGQFGGRRQFGEHRRGADA
jgi:hypothetical protein